MSFSLVYYVAKPRSSTSRPPASDGGVAGLFARRLFHS